MLYLLFRTTKLGISFGVVAIIIALVLFVCFAEKCMVSVKKWMDVIWQLSLSFRMMG